MKSSYLLLGIIHAFCVVNQVFSAPADSILSLVVSSTEPSNDKEGIEGTVVEDVKFPKIYQMHIKSNISSRFANTTITSKVRNIATAAQEATFSMILPKEAFISGFIMEVDGKNYTAYVKEKEEAKKQYYSAVANGFGAAHVAATARDSNKFTVSVNIEPETNAAFYLTYEELLKRKDGHYENVINIHPGQPVQDFSVEVLISESRKITDLKALPLRSGNEIGSKNEELDPRADIDILSDFSAFVKFSPNKERQMQLAHLMKTNEDVGLSGQFVVQYDVERDPKGGEVLVRDGYFVHFFAPSELQPLPKHVIFVLDVSGSMSGTKLTQLKEAMKKILDQLHDKDSISLVEFSTAVKVWNLDIQSRSVWYSWGSYYASGANEDNLNNLTFPNAYPATADYIKKAKDAVNKFRAAGATNIIGGLKVGLRLVELERLNRIGDSDHQPLIIKADGGTDILTALTAGLHINKLEKYKNNNNIDRQHIIVFLTDGEPTVGEYSIDQITEKISELNTDPNKASIFSLSFGNGADKAFLQKLSLRNYGFSKHIYEAADASLQLQDFYRQISSPLLADVKFKYENSVTSLTDTEFPIHFRGSEIVIAGWCGTDLLKLPKVEGIGSDGLVSLEPTVERTISSTERLWAYLTVQQLLEKIKTADEGRKELNKKALDLALKYSFVTPPTSLVVVKPNDTSAVDTVEARSQVEDYQNRSDLGAIDLRIAENEPESNAEVEFDEYTDTELPIETKSESNPLLEELLTKLPWLKYLLNENKLVKLSTGNYKLGLNKTISDYEACSNSQSGRCVLIKDCPELYPILTILDDYIQRSCILKKEYAGICCPNS